MLVLPLQSPSLVPDNVPCAPAIVMSLKSTSDIAAIDAQVNVRVVLKVSEEICIRYAEAVPALTVNVPLIVWFAPILNTPIPTVVLPVMDRLLNVLAPVIDGVVSAVDVNATL